MRKFKNIVGDAYNLRCGRIMHHRRYLDNVKYQTYRTGVSNKVNQFNFELAHNIIDDRMSYHLKDPHSSLGRLEIAESILEEL